MAVDSPVPVGVIEEGEIVQVERSGAPEQLKLTIWLNPPSDSTVSVNVAVPPAVTLAEVEFVESVKPSPLPVSETACCPPYPPLSAIVRVAVSVPVVVGVNETWTVVALPGATEIGSGFDVSPKSPAFVPVMARLEIFKVAEPELVIVNACGTLVVPRS